MSEEEKVDLQIDLDDLTLGEIEELEDAFNLSLEEIDLTRAKALAHLIWIGKRRDNPEYTLEDARKIKVSALPQPEEDEKPKRRPTQARKGK